MRALTLLLVLGVTLGCGERPEHQFATGREALSSSVGQQGWVPAWLPATSTDVRVAYDVDTNETWIRCEVEQGSRDALVKGLAPVPWAQASVVAFRSPGRAWWPHASLAEKGDGSQELFSGNGRTVLLERDSGLAFIYLWSR